MKLLTFFAHTPPPHHGQSYMVQLMLTGFGGNQRKRAVRTSGVKNSFGIECYHVNAQVSGKELEDIGDFRLGKLFLAGRVLPAGDLVPLPSYGVTTMYYIPAPRKTLGALPGLDRDAAFAKLRSFLPASSCTGTRRGWRSGLRHRYKSGSGRFTYQRGLKDVSLSICAFRLQPGCRFRREACFREAKYAWSTTAFP